MTPRRKAAPKHKPYPGHLYAGNPFNQELIAAHHDAVAAAPWLAGMAMPEPPAAPSPRLRVLCVLDGVEADHKVLDHFDGEVARLENAAADADADEQSAEANGLYDQADIAKRLRANAEKKLCARLLAVQLPGIDLDVSEEDGPIDDVNGEVKVCGQWVKVADYDLVFIDNEQPRLRYLVTAAELPPARVAFVANVKAERRLPQRVRSRQIIPTTLTAILRRIGDLVADRRRQLLLPWGIEIAYPPAPSPDDAAVDEAIVRFAQT